MSPQKNQGVQILKCSSKTEEFTKCMFQSKNSKVIINNLISKWTWSWNESLSLYKYIQNT